jgi:hypothetical protein
MSENVEGGQGGPSKAEVLVTATRAYREAWERKSVTPEVVTGYFRAFWHEAEERAGLSSSLALPDLPYSEVELTALRAKNRGIVMIPDEVLGRGPEGIKLFKRMFPDVPMVQTLWESENLSNTYTGGGCIEIEMDRIVPYKARLNTEDADDILKNQGKRGQRLATYLVGSLTNKAINDHYFDERVGDELKSGPSLSRLSGTKEYRTPQTQEFVYEATLGINQAAADIMASHVVDDYHDYHGIRVERVTSPYMQYGVRSERMKDDAEPERVSGGEGYQWVDATPLARQLREDYYDIHPIHALVIPGDETEEIRIKRKAIVAETFTREQLFKCIESPVTDDPSDPSYFVFCWIKGGYPVSSGDIYYRTTMKNFLTEVNGKLQEAGLPLFPSPLPVRAEMDEEINSYDDGELVVPKNR